MVLRKGSSNWRTYPFPLWVQILAVIQTDVFIFSHWVYLPSLMLFLILVGRTKKKKICAVIFFNILQPHLQRCRVLTASMESNGTCGNSVSLKIRPLILKMCINYSLGCNSSLDITIIYILLKKYIFQLVHCACSQRAVISYHVKASL